MIAGAVNASGRVKPVWTHSPDTGRLATRSPNLQNIPPELRRVFVAPPGSVFWSRDFKGIEAVLVGYFAQAPQYLRLAKLDVHSFVTAHVLRLPNLPQLSWSDADLASALQEIRRAHPDERRIVKRLTHGRNYGEGPRTAQDVLLSDMGLVMPLKDVSRILGLYDELFPELPRWRRALCDAVYGEPSSPLFGCEVGPGWIRNPFGLWHPYFSVLVWERQGGRWVKVMGPEAKRLIAFLPQSTARFVLTRSAQRLDPDVRATLRLLIHDELLGECPEPLAERCLDHAKAVMEQPWPELHGLAFETEGKVGRRWSDLSS